MMLQWIWPSLEHVDQLPRQSRVSHPSWHWTEGSSHTVFGTCSYFLAFPVHLLEISPLQKKLRKPWHSTTKSTSSTSTNASLPTETRPHVMSTPDAHSAHPTVVGEKMPRQKTEIDEQNRWHLPGSAPHNSNSSDDSGWGSYPPNIPATYIFSLGFNTFSGISWNLILFDPFLYSSFGSWEPWKLAQFGGKSIQSGGPQVCFQSLLARTCFKSSIRMMKNNDELWRKYDAALLGTDSWSAKGWWSSIFTTFTWTTFKSYFGKSQLPMKY